MSDSNVFNILFSKRAFLFYAVLAIVSGVFLSHAHFSVEDTTVAGQPQVESVETNTVITVPAIEVNSDRLPVDETPVDSIEVKPDPLQKAE